MKLRDQYLAESEGVKDCVKWLNKRIKEKQKAIEGSYYGDNYVEKAVINELINVKISLEKYSKKLKHMANEV